MNTPKILLDGNKKPSSKRIIGIVLISIGIAMGIGIYFMGLFYKTIIKNISVSENVYETFIYAGIIALGITVGEMFKRNK